MTVVECGETSFFIESRLAENLDAIKRRVQNDDDYFFAVDGEERAGKSVFAMQVAKYLDHSFSLKRVCFDSSGFREAILKAKPHQAVVYDEAFRGLSSRGALSEVNKLLVSLMMECGQKNLFVIVVLPTFFLLDKYVALWRAKGLFHIYRHEGKRGFWVYYNRKWKKLLYLKGKATYSYNVLKRLPQFRGRFTNTYTIEEDAYRDLKAKAFKETNRNTRAENHLEERNLLLWLINRDLQMSTPTMSNRLAELGWPLAQQSVSDAILKAEQSLRKKGLLL